MTDLPLLLEQIRAQQLKELQPRLRDSISPPLTYRWRLDPEKAGYCARTAEGFNQPHGFFWRCALLSHAAIVGMPTALSIPLQPYL